MAKPEWGLKRTCRECAKRFYDFHRDPIVCPGCQAVFDPLAGLRPRRRPAAPTPRAPAGDAPDETAEEDDADIDSEDDDGMIEADPVSDETADEEG